VSNITLHGVGFQPGAGGYFPGRYDAELKMKYVRGYNSETNEVSYWAVDLSDPTNPVVAWHKTLDESGEELCAADGKIWVGTVNGAILCFNGTSGDLLYRVNKIGFAQYSATYYEGKLIQAASSTTITCYDADTGEILWDNDQGGRAFFAFAGAAAYGRFYMHNIAVDPQGFIGCWDIETGELLWKQPALFNIGYVDPCVADGKVYVTNVDGTAAGLEGQTDEFSCYDAFTGERLWTIVGEDWDHPTIAYGNLYLQEGFGSGRVWCFSDANPDDWSSWRGNLDAHGVAQSTGPDLFNTAPMWTFQTGAAIQGSAAIVDGKVVFGSHDKNFYCLDAYTGEDLWRFAIGTRAYSTPAISGGNVYIGPDDGNAYCLDLDTGEVVWEQFVTSKTVNVFAMTWQPRSSPIVVGGRLYVGALDGKIYCLSTSNGAVQWTYQTGNKWDWDTENPIGGSPAYSNGVVFIASTDHTLYALDATDGDLVWSYESDVYTARAYTNWFPMSTPTISGGKVYWGAGPVYGDKAFWCLNETDGSVIWKRSLTGNTPLHATPVVVDDEYVIHPEFMGVAVSDAETGDMIWHQWLGHEVFASVAYANDYRGPRFYVGSNTYSLTCFDAEAAFENDTENAVLGIYQTKSNIQSSPAIWDGKVYIGSTDGVFYMFDDHAYADFTIVAATNKGAQMYNTETLVIEGRLQPTVTDDLYGSYPANGLPDATVKLSLTTPAGSDVSMDTTTDDYGYFSFSYSPTEVGEWGWVVYFEGGEHPWITYNEAYGSWNPLTVNEPPGTGGNGNGNGNGNGTEPPPADGIPIEYVYAAIAVVVIVVVVIVAYMLLRRK
jgi:outer membrane protein assembly factor BamB